MGDLGGHPLITFLAREEGAVTSALKIVCLGVQWFSRIPAGQLGSGSVFEAGVPLPLELLQAGVSLRRFLKFLLLGDGDLGQLFPNCSAQSRLAPSVSPGSFVEVQLLGRPLQTDSAKLETLGCVGGAGRAPRGADGS